VFGSLNESLFLNETDIFAQPHVCILLLISTGRRIIESFISFILLKYVYMPLRTYTDRFDYCSSKPKRGWC